MLCVQHHPNAADANLLDAVRSDNHALTLEMLRQGASPNGVCSSAVPLLEAILSRSYDCVDALIAAGADPTCSVAGAGESHMLAMSYAVDTDDARPIRAIAAAQRTKWEVGHADNPLRSELLDSAVRNNLLVSIATLLDLKVNPDAQSVRSAVYHGHVEGLRLLLAAGAPINCRDYNNETPLMIATSLGHVGCLRMLLDHGADIEARGNSGWKALTNAVAHSRLDCAEELLSSGAKIDDVCDGHCIVDMVDAQLSAFPAFRRCADLAWRRWVAAQIPGDGCRSSLGLPGAALAEIVRWVRR